MFESTGNLRYYRLLLLVCLLVFSWSPAGARQFESLPRGVVLFERDDLVGGLQQRSYLPANPVALVSRDLSKGKHQEPQHWPGLESRLVSHPVLRKLADEVRIPSRPAGTCTVSSASDSGPNTLRQCLIDVVAGDEIRFDATAFPPGAPVTINLASDLPWILDDNLTINASDAGVILDGSALDSDSRGLLIAFAHGVTVRGLQIRNFDVGVMLWGATDCTVGGDRSTGAGPLGEGNLISANATAGVHLEGVGTSDNSIIGNFIGTDISGSTADANGYAGISIAYGAAQNVIGGDRSAEACDGPCNLISGNFVGIQIQDDGSDSNTVKGNYIGTDLSGNSANGNEVAGIVVAYQASQNIIGGARSPAACDGPCNLISGNLDLGVVIQNAGTGGNQILGNFLGTNISGDAALANNHGVVVGIDATETQIGGTGAGEGNLISGNTNLGIWISSAGAIGNQILGNLIGTDITGATGLPNYHGILISESTGNQVGGAGAGRGNLISGNEFSGIELGHQATPGNTIAGNKIGTNLAGTYAVPNYVGISLVEASNNMIGGSEPGAGNLISGNIQEGVHLGTNCNSNSVQGNTIGTDVAGEIALPNAFFGVFIGFGASNNTIGGSMAGGGNLISGSGQAGIHVQGEASLGNRVLGNRIGTNRVGSSAIPNYNGVVVILAPETIIGGADTSTPWVCDGPCNLISGNTVFGVVIQGVSAASQRQTIPDQLDNPVVADQDNQVLGNFIGTDLAGTAALPNAAGVDLSYEATGNLVGGNSGAGESNLISGNQREGIVVRHALTTHNQISGNRVGIQADGTSALPNLQFGIWIYASGNTVGGEAAGLGNVISGQALDLGYYGVLIGAEAEPEARDNQIIGNRIGTNPAGTNAIPNGGGVALAWGATGSLIRGNVISGNARHAVYIWDAPQNELSDNHIGVALDGQSSLANYGIGIYLCVTPENLIGPGNIIAYNAIGVGVQYPESFGNTITQNSIYANYYEQIEFADVPAPLAPAPLLTSWDGETVSGTACSGCQVEVFASPSFLPAGQTYLGTTTAAGDGGFDLKIAAGYRFLTATATDADGTTSEFANSLFIGEGVRLPQILKAVGVGN